MNKKKVLTGIIGILSTISIAMVAYHSVWEIHYLKTFYPNNFTVIEASYASNVELIKVVLVILPITFGYFVIRDYLKD